MGKAHQAGEIELAKEETAKSKIQKKLNQGGTLKGPKVGGRVENRIRGLWPKRPPPLSRTAALKESVGR